MGEEEEAAYQWMEIREVMYVRHNEVVPEDGVPEQEEMGQEEEKWEETGHWSEEAALALMGGMETWMEKASPSFNADDC